jgi:hypothetical protein
MALANVTYPSDGTVLNYLITFNYLDRTHIAVFVGGVDTTDVSSAYTFQFTDDTHVDVTTLAGAAVPAGAAIKIARITPTNSTATVFADGAVVRASALNANTNQLLYISQEVKDNDAFRMGVANDDKFDALNKVIKNVANPTNPTDVTTKTYVEDTWLTLSDKAQLNSLNLSNLNTVATDVTNVNTTATDITNVNTVATDINNVNTLAGISQAVTDVAAIDTEIDILVNKYDGSTTATSGTNKNITQVDAVADNATNINTVANAATDIGLLADLQDGTTGTNVLTTVNNRQSQILTLAQIEDGTNATNAISTAATRASDIVTVAARDTDIGTLADLEDGTTATNALSNLGGQSAKLDAIHDDLTEINQVHGSLNNINSLAPRVNDLTTLSPRATDIATLADVQDGTTATNALSNLGSLGNQLTNLGSTTTASYINTLGPLSTEIGQVAAINTQVSQVAGVRLQVANIDSRKTQLVDATDSIYNKINQLTTVYNNISDINSVADNISGITSFAETYFSGATAPTGATINAGDLWYDSTSNNLKYYNGSSWVIATTSVNGTANRNTYTATAGQTTFSATYDAGYIDVYLNGIKLIVGTDFTATSGTDIVLATGATLNDTVDIVGYGVFNVANVNFSINDADDVNTAGLTNGQVLAFNSSTSDFEPVDANAGAALLSGATFTGAVVVENQLDIEEVHEKVTVITSTTGTLTFDTAVQGVVFSTANQTANRTINFTNVNSTLDIGQSVTCAVMLSQGSTAYYLNAYQVDTSSVTPKWQGGTAPTAGNVSGIDAYSFTIIKTADATFTVLASQTAFA